MSPWAIIAIVLGSCLVIAIVLVVALAAIMFPVMSQARESARKASCVSNLKQISTGLAMYAMDYDQRFPPKTTWQDALFPYIKNNGVFICPSDQTRVSSYAYNARLHQLPMGKVLAPATTPAIFESLLSQRNGSDTLASFAPRHRNMGNIAYADGHVKAVTTAPPANAGLAAK